MFYRHLFPLKQFKEEECSDSSPSICYGCAKPFDKQLTDKQVRAANAWCESFLQTIFMRMLSSLFTALYVTVTLHFQCVAEMLEACWLKVFQLYLCYLIATIKHASTICSWIQQCSGNWRVCIAKLFSDDNLLNFTL